MVSIAERRKVILEQVNREGYAKVSELARLLNVTPATIRKDLRILEDHKLLLRAHGSAMPPVTQVRDVSIHAKKPINYGLKQRIGAAACQLIDENDSIIIASGSTMTVFAESIRPAGHLNVVSPSINISMLFGENPNVTLMQLGGVIYGNSLSVRGEPAVSELRNLFCSKLFFGVDGFSLENGLTCSTIEEANFTQHMMHAVSRSIVLADSTKVGRLGFGRICALEDVDVLVTDSGIPDKIRQDIEAMGVEVIVA